MARCWALYHYSLYGLGMTPTHDHNAPTENDLNGETDWFALACDILMDKAIDDGSLGFDNYGDRA